MISVSLKRSGRYWAAAVKVIDTLGMRATTVRAGSVKQVLHRAQRWVEGRAVVVGWWDARGVVCCEHATDVNQDPLFAPAGGAGLLDTLRCAECSKVVTFDAVSSSIDTF